MASDGSTPGGDPVPPPEDKFLKNLFDTMYSSLKRDTPCAVHKFDGNDFHRWLKQIFFHFKEADIWDVVSAPLPDVPLRGPAWSKVNDKVLATIYRYPSEEQQELIDHCVFAKDAWDLLTKVYDKLAVVTVLKLLDDLNDLTKHRDESITQYMLTRAKKISHSIKAAGESCTDRHVSSRILTGLPRSFGSVRETLTISRGLDFEILTSSL